MHKAQVIVQMRENHRALILESGLGVRELRLLDFPFQRPQVNTGLVMETMDVAPLTANRLLARLADLHLVEEITGGKCSRVFRYTPYWRLFQEPEPLESPEAPVQTTESGS